jgi:hypothetical protein
LARTASQYVAPARNLTGRTRTEFHAPAFGERSNPEVRRDRGCRWLLEYNPANRVVARARPATYTLIDAAAPDRRARKAKTSAVPSALRLTVG